MSRAKKITVMVIIIVAALVAACLVALNRMDAVADAAVEKADGRILKNVYIDTVDVGALSRDEATAAVEKLAAKADDSIITLKAGRKEKKIRAGRLNIDYKISQAVDRAFEVGREGNILARFKSVRELKNEDRHIRLHAAADPAEIKKAVRSAVRPLAVRAVPAYLRRVEVKREDKKAESEKHLPVKWKVIKVKEVKGQKVNREKSGKRLAAAINNKWEKGDMTVDMSVRKITPRVTESDFKDIHDVLGTYTTEFDGDDVSRSRNLVNGVRKISGTFLQPGQRLSVYKKVAPFTAENGWHLAGTYSGGKEVMDYGGGICQVSTTLYNAVIRSELKVNERHNHSMPVSYVPLSADATISGSDLDFKFTNNLDDPIYISGKVHGESLTFTIYGTETRKNDRYVDFESETLASYGAGEQVVGTDP
ncbi:MAG: VanW family protein [Anaerovoracaceae bacterium]|jgi:vancomycin resistance protein YoaR